MAFPTSAFQSLRRPPQAPPQGGVGGLVSQQAAGGRQPPASMPGMRPPPSAAPGGMPGPLARASGMFGGSAPKPQGPQGSSLARASGMFGGNGGAPTAPAAQGPRMAPRMPQMGFAMSDEASKQEVERLRERVRDLGGGPDAGGASSSPDFGQRLAGAAGHFKALSDETSKQKISDLEAALRSARGGDSQRSEAFRGVTNNEYEYKPEFRDQPGAGHGKFRGPMADELRPLGVTEFGGDGMERVNMERLPLETAGEVGNQRRELDELRQRLADLEGNPDAVLDVAGGRR